MASVRVRFLGSDDAVAGGGPTCILIESDGSSCLVDCGAPSLDALKRAGFDPGSLGTVLISDLHEARFGGLPFLIADGQFSRRSGLLRVAGPPGLEARVSEAMATFFPSAQRRFEVEIRELSEGVAASLGALRVTPSDIASARGAASYALRIEVAGRVISYSGGVVQTDRPAGAAPEADLFVGPSHVYGPEPRPAYDGLEIVLSGEAARR